MEILSAKQLKEADEYTLKAQHISAWDLMERASSKLFEAIKHDFLIAETHFTVFCGTGNNGGDGLALTRMLYQEGSDVKVYLKTPGRYSECNLTNQEKLRFLKIHPFGFDTVLEFPKESVLVDAVFGYGLNRPLSQDWKNVIKQINDSGNIILAVDTPSGLLADEPTPGDAPIIRAKQIYSFHCPKLAFLLPGNSEYAADFKVLDIGLETEVEAKLYYVEKQIISPWLKVPTRFSHKGTFGHALIVGGGYGSIGAVILSSKAALKTGCGLLTAYVPSCGYIPLQSAFQEAQVKTDKSEKFITSFSSDISSYSAMGIGVGMGTEKNTIEAFTSFLESKPNVPMVLDADALNILAQKQELFSKLPKDTILTPHPKELQRIIGTWENDFEKIKKVKELSRKYKIIVVVKGANTAIVLPDGRIYFNSTGNYGMATAGSGDVLTGIITSLLAQKHSPEKAAILGVFLHGLAGDFSVQKIHPKSLIASDIINGISEAWKAAFKES